MKWEISSESDDGDATLVAFCTEHWPVVVEKFYRALVAAGYDLKREDVAAALFDGPEPNPDADDADVPIR